MISKELKRLSRRELVDIIYQLKKNEQEQQEELEALRNQLQDKRLRIEKAGSVAEAALAVTDVFAVAQRAADLYLKEIASMKEETEKECALRIEQTEKRVQEILAEGDRRLDELTLRYKEQSQLLKELQERLEEPQGPAKERG